MEKLSDHKKGIAAILFAALLWSTGGVFIKLISFNSLQLSFFRSLLSAITILVLFRRRAVLFNTGTMINGLFYAAILILFVVAAKSTTVANAIFLQYTAPIYVFILEPLMLKTKFERINLITILICIAGMFLFFAGDLSPGDKSGNLAAILSGICFAGFLIGMRKNKPEYQFATIFYGNVFISLFCSFSVFALNEIQATDVIMVSYLGIFQIGLAYVIFSYGLKKVNAIEASLISMIEPVLNPVWTYIGYGEVPSIYSIFGGLIIIAGLTIKTFQIEKSKFFKYFFKR
ncbi:MAG TPA: EamA family transporter [Ignavibacteriaceae bacterium]|nr:EamA family transporter [Ignavibacteriaceae bacterium]